MDATMSAVVYKASASKPEIYHFADRIKINGETKNLDGNIEAIAALLRADAATAKPTGEASANVENDTNAQPIRFTVNPAGKINAITTVSGTSTQEASKLKVATYVSTGLECTLKGTTLGGYTISDETKIISVPKNRTQGTYSTLTSSHFKENKSYYVQIVNATSTKLAKCIYYYGEVGGESGDISAQITEDTMPMIVKAISGVNVDNSNKKFTLLNIATGNETVCYDNDVAGTQDLTVGDIVRVATTQRKEYDNNDELKDFAFIEELEVLADAEGVVASTFSPFEKTDGEGEGVKYDFRTLIGTVTAKDNDSKTFLIVPGYDHTVGTEENYKYSDAKFYMVDTTETQQNNIVKNASSENFGYYSQPGISSKLFIYTKDAQIKSIVIFK